MASLSATAIGEDNTDSIKQTHRLEEVVVTSSAKKLNSAEIGTENVQLKDMQKLPSLFGERDIIRSLQLLPGVKAESDASSGFQVRGGTTGQNNILLDDATVYNAGHLMGLFSTFNDAVLASANLYKGTPPAQFGGGTSSVLNVVTKKAQPKFSLAGTVGILSAKLSADIPISKKIAAFVSARITYFDVFLKLIKKYRGTTMNFYDINAKINFDFNDDNRLCGSFFRGRDNMGLDDLMQSGWGNTLGNIRYWHAFNDKHEMNTSVFLSSYTLNGDMDMSDISNSYNAGIKHVGLKQSFEWSPSEVFTLNYGLQSRFTDLISLKAISPDLTRQEERHSWENDVWAGADLKPTEWLAMNVGVRLNMFSVLGGAPYYEIDKNGNITNTYNYSSGKFVKTYFSLEPRFTANLKVNKTASIKLGYARTGQNIRPLYNNGMMATFNRYTMSSNIFQPEKADQVSLGFVKLIKDGAYELSAEAYYKTLDNVLDYKDGKNFTSEVEIERIILAGKGRSYGFEVMAKKNLGKLTGWVSYTLSWTQNKIEGINNGEWYTASNDRRHDISIAAMYNLTKKWLISATWVFQSGQALTVPSAKYDIGGETIYYYSERNGYRAPAYHRLDISATYKRQHFTKKGRQWSSEWCFGIYNVYNRYNPYTITFKNDNNRPSGTKATLTALFGILPSISYNFYF